MSIDLEAQYVAALEQLTAEENHICQPYEAQAEQFSASIPFLRVGLERNEKCLYIASESSAGTVIGALRAAGIDTDSNVRQGRLTITTAKLSFLKYGDFQPGWMIGFLKQAIDGAQAEGCSGLRAVCEMGWASQPGFPDERLFEYETKAGCFLQGYPRAILCQYDQRQFAAATIAQVIRRHPRVVHKGMLCSNPYHIPPEEFLDVKPNMHEVRRLLTNILGGAQLHLELQNALADLKRAN